jgi:hypothetical protein
MAVDREPVTLQTDLNDEVATATQLQIKPSLREGPGHARFQHLDRDGMSPKRERLRRQTGERPETGRRAC